jgi:hypothetical protein
MHGHGNRLPIPGAPKLNTTQITRLQANVKTEIHGPPQLTCLTTSRRLYLSSTDIRLKTAHEVISVQESGGIVEDPGSEEHQD